MSEVLLNIYQRVNAVRSEVGYIQKDKSVPTGGGSYKAVTHDKVTAEIRGALIKHGIVCVPNLIRSNSLDKAHEAKQFRYEAVYKFTFVNVDKPEESLSIETEGHAMDNADKAPGKALSYAKKYAVLKLFELETGEDEESRVRVEEFITEDQVSELIGFAKKHDVDMSQIRKQLMIDNIEYLPSTRFNDAVELLKSHAERKLAEKLLRECVSIEALSLAWNRMKKFHTILRSVKDECKAKLSAKNEEVTQ